MKNDQNKPKASNFYWDGLAKIARVSEGARAIILYQQFCFDLKLETLKWLYWEIIDKQPNPNKIFEDVFHVCQHGADKYGEKNYLQLPLERYIEALGRHLGKAYGAYPIDDESGYPHIAHVLANILIAAELLIE